MTVHAKLHRAYEIRTAPAPMLVEFHDPGCRCPVCASFEPAVRPVAPALTFIDIGLLALAGALVGSVIAFTIGPHGAWHALASCFGAR